MFHAVACGGGVRGRRAARLGARRAARKTRRDAARRPRSPSSPPAGVNAPPAGATLILLGTSATLDRAADSGSRVRIALAGSPPTLASVPVSTGPDGRPAPPQTQAVASALAALPPRSPLVLVGAAPDGAQRSVVLALGDTPPASSAPDSNGIVTVVFEGDVVDSPADVALSRGAAAGYVSAPGRVSRAALPARAAFAGGAAVYVDVRW